MDRRTNVYVTLTAKINDLTREGSEQQARISELERIVSDALTLLDANPLGTVHDASVYRAFRASEYAWRARALATIGTASSEVEQALLLTRIHEAITVIEHRSGRQPTPLEVQAYLYEQYHFVESLESVKRNGDIVNRLRNEEHADGESSTVIL